MAEPRAGALPSRPTPKGTSASSKPPKPWQWRIEGRSLIILLPDVHRVLSWAPFNGGAMRARAIVNHQVAIGDRAATEHPGPYLQALVRGLAMNPRTAVAMMTGVKIQRVSHTTVSHDRLMVGAWCTAGCSNALRVGDPGTAAIIRPGTINLALVINQALSPSATVEALAIAIEARTAAVLEAGIRSTRTGLPATGTGTDCVVVASPLRGPAHIYCGKHTVVGELVGKAAMRVCRTALRRCIK